MQHKSKQQGFTLIEFMISMVLASVLGLSVVSVWSSQVKVVYSDINRIALESEVNMLYDVIFRLIKQSSAASIVTSQVGVVSSGGTQSVKTTRVDFSLVPGFNIWPNNQSPYLNNDITLSWTSNPASVATINSIYVNNTNTNLTVLAGSSSDDQMQIVDFELWPLDATGKKQALVGDAGVGGYLLTIEGRASTIEHDYMNPKYTQSDHPLHNYRTYVVSGVIYPRNS